MHKMVLEVNKRGVLLATVILASICYILYSTGDEINPDPQAQGDSPPEEKSFQDELKSVGTEDEDAYADIGLDVVYTEDFVTIRGIDVFYIYAKSTVTHEGWPRFPVLLFHGAAYSSETWKSLGTLQFLATSGYFPVAIDLPGFGKTKSKIYEGDKAEFVQNLISVLLDNEKPIIVTPSMSGLFSLPYIFKYQSDVRGFVPVSPVNRYTENDYKKLDIPALIVYGALDTAGEKTSNIIANMPNCKLLKVANGQHAVYLDDPALFHNQMKIFLDGVYDTI